MGVEPPVPLKPWNHVTSFKDLKIDDLKIDDLKIDDFKIDDFKIDDLKIDDLKIEGLVQQKSLNQKSLNPKIELRIVRLDSPVVGVAGLEMMGLRKSHAVLSAEEYKLAGKAAELIYWDQNTKYCGCCGAPNKWQTEISKQCTECGKEWWPSVATAIIVRITRFKDLKIDHLKIEDQMQQQSLNQKSLNRQMEEILLVRAKNFRTNHYGLVAGFLETGENLEEAVVREVHEETGISIKNLRYFGSQAWPYPFGLMVGFTADYAGGEIRLQREELTEGGWFTRDNLPPIPDKASIARRLIDDWLLQA
ncbi:MAG: NAD(+) diphosphatase [Bacteroidales bacterium]|nr:NAD(+) diphosphatase [Bacteroidales bacterium]